MSGVIRVNQDESVVFVYCGRDEGQLIISFRLITISRLDCMKAPLFTSHVNWIGFVTFL